MRWFFVFMVFANGAQAWEFTPGLPCLLTHSTSQAHIELTFDPVTPLYSLSITTPAPLARAPVFRMRFDGPQGREIGTTQHQYSTDGHTLSVSDRGFGNVLDGLQFNHTATALMGSESLSFPLEDAADAVAAFRACEARPLAS